MKPNRRVALKGAGVAALMFAIDGEEHWLSAQEARARRVRYQVLTTPEVRTLEVLGDTLLPGAAGCGITHFVDHQLAGDPSDALLLIRHLDWPGPLTEFYQQGLREVEAAAQRSCATRFSECDADARKALIDALWAGSVDGWEGPPSPLFYLAVRADAVDVVYGTVKGFERLEIPYIPHIEPKEAW